MKKKHICLTNILIFFCLQQISYQSKLSYNICFLPPYVLILTNNRYKLSFSKSKKEAKFFLIIRCFFFFEQMFILNSYHSMYCILPDLFGNLPLPDLFGLNCQFSTDKIISYLKKYKYKINSCLIFLAFCCQIANTSP